MENILGDFHQIGTLGRFGQVVAMSVSPNFVPFLCYSPRGAKEVPGEKSCLPLWHQYQGCPKPGKQGTNKFERILANLGKTEQTGQNWQKTAFLGKNGAKRGKKWAKPSKNRRTKPNHGETGQNRKFRRI